jgi:phosphotriesterase-related protein
MFEETFVSKMSEKWISDFELGLDTVDGTVIRPGYIKLLLERGILNSHDKDLLRAAVITTKRTGIPIHCHIMEYQMVYDVIDLLEKEEADLSKFLWAHADQDGHIETIKYAYNKGIWIGFDMIQVGTYDKKVTYIKQAIKDGHMDRILLSQDYEMYDELKKHGDKHKCTSFFKEFIPYCENEGITKETLLNVMTKNPAEFYDVK